MNPTSYLHINYWRSRFPSSESCRSCLGRAKDHERICNTYGDPPSTCAAQSILLDQLIDFLIISDSLDYQWFGPFFVIQNLDYDERAHIMWHMPLMQPAICIGLCVFSMLCWQFCMQSKRVPLLVTIRARHWRRSGTITAWACAGVRAEGFLVTGKSYLFPWASNARTVVVSLGRGRAWTVIADTAIPSVHPVPIPWTPSPCHWPNEEIRTRELFAYMTP